MSLAAFGARMPYDEALGSLVGAKKWIEMARYQQKQA